MIEVGPKGFMPAPAVMYNCATRPLPAFPDPALAVMPDEGLRTWPATPVGIGDVRELGRGLSIVSPDNLRRDILKGRDIPGGANIALIDITARHALRSGYHVITEGICALTTPARCSPP